jgi:DNA-binding transcriptional LysR family regulator
MDKNMQLDSRWRTFHPVEPFCREPVKPKSTLRFNQYDQVIAAAIAGQGIALGHLDLIRHMLADGRLQVLTAPRAGPTTSYGYWPIKAKPKPRSDFLATAQRIKSQAEAIEAGDRF